MPFTVFSTKQKSKMIKWMEDRRGGGGGGNEKQSETRAEPVSMDVIGINDDNTICVATRDGSEFFDNVRVRDEEVFREIKDAWAELIRDVEVLVERRGDEIEILELEENK